MNDSKVSKVSCNAGTFVSARAILVSICAALSLIALSACVTKTVAPSTVPMVSFQLLPPATIQSGGQAQLIAVVTNDPKMMGIDWNPSCTTTSCGSFNPTHTVSGQPTTYTAPTSAPQGGVNLAARATALPAQTAVVNVTIFTNVTIKLTGFPASPLGAGNTTSITAVVSGDPNNPPLGVGWSFTCTVSNCGSLSAPQTASGSAVTYTAPASVTTGFTVVIQATPLADTTQIITTSITVNPSSSVQVAFNPGPPGNIPAGTTVMVAATVSNDPQAGGVNWSVTCTNSAAAGQCGTFANPPHTASGVLIAYTAPATVPAGGLPVVITAASADVPSSVANASSNITNPALSVAITTGPPSSMPVSTTAPLVATLQNDTSNKGVTWMASCTAATGSTCGSFSLTATTSGMATTYQAPTVVPTGGGVVTITATTVATPVATATAMVTITPANSVSINWTSSALTPPSSLALGAPVNISATVTNDPVTAPNGVSWAANCTPGTGGDCGTFSVNPTQNMLNTTYTAPTVLPLTPVTIVATAQAAPNPTVSQQVTIQPPTLTVTINPPIPTTIEAGTSTQFTATVTNDSTPAKGVNWSVTCIGGTGTNPCGSFSPVNTLSTIATTYTAPTAVPSGGTVTITATSAAQSNISASTPAIPVTANVSAGLLKGQYALNISGQNGNPFLAVLGSIIADGQGGITGEEDAAPPCGPITVSVTGTYTVGSDGRGTMTIDTGGNGCFGTSGTQTLSLTIAGGPGSPAPRALVSEFDNGAGSGSLDLQDTADIAKGLGSISGSYAFVFDGFDINNTNPNTGISTTDVGGTIAVSGTSMAFAQDVNDQGTGTVTKPSQTLTFGAPDNFGRGTATNSTTGVSYVFYVVNAGQIKFLENDGNNFVEIGSAYSQGTFTPGNFVFTTAGVDGSLNNLLGDGLVVAGGAFTASTSALTNGIIDVNDNGATPILGTAFTGTITAPTNGRGTLTLTSTLVGISQFAYYPTAKNGLLLMELDAGFAAIGDVLPQPASITTTNFSGNYAMNFTDATAGLGYQEEDSVGLVMADGVGTFTGTVDLLNTAGNLTLGDALVTGSTFVGAGNPGQGRFTGIFVIALNSSTNQTQKEIFYMADPNTVLFIQGDSQAQTSGIMLMQNLTP
jgi:hypothetical protein